MHKLLGTNDFTSRLQHALSTASHIDIATAWATCGDHLDLVSGAVEKTALKVRAIVGVSGNSTHPEALEKLDQIGDVRLVAADRLFHPKLYIFRCADDQQCIRAWIGSANFTSRGFGSRRSRTVLGSSNEEIMLEVSPGHGARELARWFQERWGRCEPLDPNAIKDYRRNWTWSPPRRTNSVVTADARVELLAGPNRPTDFAGYYWALRQCNQLWKNELEGSQDAWTVLGEFPSYVTAIRRRSKLLGTRSWNRLDREEERRIKGVGSWGLLGKMIFGQWNHLKEHEPMIQPILSALRGASDDDLVDRAVQAFARIKGIHNVGEGTTSLLLALTRPDRLPSVNGRSKEGLATLSQRFARTTKITAKEYRELLGWLDDQPWNTPAAEPADHRMNEVWKLRGALIDAFVYRP